MTRLRQLAVALTFGLMVTATLAMLLAVLLALQETNLAARLRA